MVRRGYNYRSRCLFCGVRPFSEGPHHSVTCARHQPTQTTGNDLALSHECRYCGVRPFVAGPHHLPDCRRFFIVEQTGLPFRDDKVGEPLERGRLLSLDTVLAVFRSQEVPLLTVTELAEALGCSPEAAGGAVAWLVDRGVLYRKPVARGEDVYLLVSEPLDPS
ncbi:hypothetical protein [Halomarina litorea]|uniref:hypothetical protein n=1 Tax=Halomarina litorea TaxID=2961595 RepID=UPI0020C4FA3F|nr:hypothetical protein [Halomarina sp. BCD28]